jgi:hypothetical protein
MGQGYRVGGPEVINQLLCFLFCGARDWTQGFVYTRQTLYHSVLCILII